MRKLVLAVVLFATACGGDDERLTIYLKQRLGPDGPPGQVAPLLMPVERVRRDMPPERQAIVALRQGPAPDERARGFLDTLGGGTWLRGVSVGDEVATVNLRGAEPDFYGSAAIVYSLTSIPGIKAVRLLLDGKPCCFYSRTTPSRPIAKPHTRDSFTFWQGAPCAARSHRDAVRCRNE